MTENHQAIMDFVESLQNSVNGSPLTVGEIRKSLLDIIQPTELLTVPELANTLRTPISWVYAQTRQTGPNAIPAIRCGKYIRFNLDDVMEWLNRGRRN